MVRVSENLNENKMKRIFIFDDLKNKIGVMRMYSYSDYCENIPGSGSIRTIRKRFRRRV